MRSVNSHSSLKALSTARHYLLREINEAVQMARKYPLMEAMHRANDNFTTRCQCVHLYNNSLFMCNQHNMHKTAKQAVLFNLIVIGLKQKHNGGAIVKYIATAINNLGAGQIEKFLTRKIVAPHSWRSGLNSIKILFFQMGYNSHCLNRNSVYISTATDWYIWISGTEQACRQHSLTFR